MGDGTTGETTNKSTPVRVQKVGETAGPLVDNITKWKAVSAGDHHTVGIAEDGSLWSWGDNGNGQLGDGTEGFMTANKSTPVRLKQGGTTWKAVSAGGEHTVGIDIDGNLWSWGANGNGQLGDGTEGFMTANKSTPVQVQQAGITWKAVSAGGEHTVGIDIDGNLWSWGQNGNGQLGDGTRTGKRTPVRVQKTEAETFVDNTTKWKAVAVGNGFTVGIDIDGNLWSWGYNGSGQLGDGTTSETTNKSTPVQVQQAGITWKAVAGGFAHTVGIDSDGTLWSWGANASGQLGDGTTTNRNTPVKIQIPK